MQTRIELPGGIYQHISNTRVKLNRSERSVVDWAMVDDHQSVLELSCEQDRLINYYQSQYHIRACGLCFDIELAQQLRSSLERAEIMSSMNGDIPWQSDSFNRILMSNALPYYLSLQEFLSEIYRVLAPGGKLVLALPSINIYRHQLSFKSDTSIWKQFLLQLEKTGFKDVSCNRTRFIQRCLIAYKH